MVTTRSNVLDMTKKATGVDARGFKWQDITQREAILVVVVATRKPYTMLKTRCFGGLLSWVDVVKFHSKCISPLDQI